MRRTILKRAGIFLNCTEELIWATQKRMATEFIKHLLWARSCIKGFASPISLNSQMSQSSKELTFILIMQQSSLLSVIPSVAVGVKNTCVSKSSNYRLKNSMCKIFWHTISLFSLFPGLQTLTNWDTLRCLDNFNQVRKEKQLKMTLVRIEVKK